MGHVNIVRLLLQKGARVHQNNLGFILQYMNNDNSSATNRELKNIISRALGRQVRKRRMIAALRASTQPGKIKTIPLPNRLRNNTNTFTGQRFMYGIPYFEVKSRGEVHYYSKSGFEKWRALKKSAGQPFTNLYTREPLKNKNIRLVVFEIPQNIKNKANSALKTRAARTIQTAFRKSRWNLPN
jgi:hypothetical protein